MAIPAKSAGELNFRAQVEAQRKRHWLAVKAGACGFLLVSTSLMLPQKWLVWIGVPGAGFVLISLLLFFTAPLLNCPDCGESAEDFGPFCPVCSSEGLRRSLAAAKCDGCHRALDHYKIRNYFIHFCTHCGRLIDRRGTGLQAVEIYGQRR